ncbi:MAG: hypothetical protein AB1791_23245 [Chloroflexota bacterium]
MSRYNEDQWNPDHHEPPRPSGWWATIPTWLEGLPGPWQWDELAAEVGQESQARVVIAGLTGCGKTLLFNRLRGWLIGGELEIRGFSSAPVPQSPNPRDSDLCLEPFGSFILARLPMEANGSPLAGDELLLSLGDPALIVYLLDATAGVRPADYRWVATLRAGGRPLVVALNKCDLQADYRITAAEAEQRLGMPVIPVSAQTGLHVEERLLPALLDAAPKVSVPLGREVLCLRRLASRRLIRQAALFAGLVGAQPIPLLDLPFQAMLQVGVVMRVAAVYGRVPTGGVNREVISTVASSLGLRYLALTLAKLVPILGWAIGGLLSAGMTVLLGEAAIRYYEAGGRIPLHLRRGRVRG